MTIPDLIERLEKAIGPDTDLDEMISATLFPKHEFMQLKDAPEGVGCMMYRWPDWQQVSALRVTSSIDAAAKLCELVAQGCAWTLDTSHGFYASVWEPDKDGNFVAAESTYQVQGASAPIALCIAILRALQAKEGE